MNSGSPWPVTAETGMMGAFSRKVSRVNSLTSSCRELQHLLVHEVDLGQDDQPVAHAEQRADLHVLAGLGHDSLVGRDHHGDDVDPGGAGHHVLDELFMARNVHDS